MPQANRFRHQAYAPTRPVSPHYVLSPGSYPVVGSRPFRQRMEEVGAALRGDGVAAIWLVHGSFDGPLAVRALAELAGAFPAAGPALCRVVHRLREGSGAEVPQFSERYAAAFDSAINPPGQRPIPVHLFQWSGENHHLGRADAAVRLIDELAALGLRPGQRVLLWGHGHAGNVFALMTNLLAGHADATEEFFQAAEVYYRWPVLGLIDIPVWQRVRRRLRSGRPFLEGAALDLVTFGTPIRYGWDSGGYSRLLHFIHHRPAPGLPAYRAAWPPDLDDVLKAAGGDYVQQLGIAGTNSVPSVSSWRARWADRRLARLVQAGSSDGPSPEPFRAGAIVPDEGTTLLVDYGEPGGSIAQHQAGHAVYTRRRWLLFHAEEVARRFYASQTCMVA